MKRAALSVYHLCLFALFFAANGLNALTIPASEDSYTAPRNTLSYSTNNTNALAIESLNMQLRQLLKNRGHFPCDEAATKLASKREQGRRAPDGV